MKNNLDHDLIIGLLKTKSNWLDKGILVFFLVVVSFVLDVNRSLTTRVTYDFAIHICRQGVWLCFPWLWTRLAEKRVWLFRVWVVLEIIFVFYRCVINLLLEISTACVDISTVRNRTQKLVRARAFLGA